MTFDLLTTVEYGGCSAKFPAQALKELLDKMPSPKHSRLLVDIDTHDDAGVYQLTDDIALVQTTDFFPPICSDPYEFGQIAAANALSDVFAMGGKALTALNLVMFPAEGIPMEVLAEILRGGMDKVTEAGAVIAGGHTIADSPPKYGLAVTGIVHPQKIITNSAARLGDVLILTKALGTGIIIAGKKMGEVSASDYQAALDSMKQLNMNGALVMQQYGVNCATDITGFGLLGHASKMAEASHVTLRINTSFLPVMSGAYALLELGCIPGAAFKNQAFVEPSCRFTIDIDYNLKMLSLDAQTSGGLLICISKDLAPAVVSDLRKSGYPLTTIVGEVIEANGFSLEIF